MGTKKVIPIKVIWSSEGGSLTLEATVVFPVFLAILLFLINLVNTAVVYIAMDHAVSETVKQLAAQSYPLKSIGMTYVTGSPDKTAETVDRLKANPEVINTESGKQLVAAMGADVFTLIAGKTIEKGTAYGLEPVVKSIAGLLIKKYCPLKNLSDSDFEISELRIYNPNNADRSNNAINGISINNEDIAITVRYKVKVSVPFLPLSYIYLSNTAVERAWADDN
jgi:hypothetical protein